MQYSLDTLTPKCDSTSYVAPGAHVIGNVILKPHSSVWFNVVIRCLLYTSDAADE